MEELHLKIQSLENALKESDRIRRQLELERERDSESEIAHGTQVELELEHEIACSTMHEASEHFFPCPRLESLNKMVNSAG